MRVWIKDLLGSTILVAQKVNDAYPWGSTHTYLLMENPSPSDLEDSDTSDLDYEEKTGITDTSEALQIDKTFVLADLVGRPRQIGAQAVRAVCSVSIARTGETDGNIYWTKATFNLGVMDSSGNFTSKVSADATPNFSTNSADYQTCSGQAFLDLSTGFTVAADERLALRVRVYGYIATTENAKMRLNCSRGSADSYIELFLR